MVKRRGLAVIPARGGSKRLPRKNIVEFGGRPLLAWSVEAALSSALFDRVIVSTDDPDIADAARAAGADVPFVRELHADDHSNVSDVTVHALRVLQAEGAQFDVVAMLQPTCPLRSAAHVRSSWDAFERSGAGFQVSCYETKWINPWWAFQRNEDGTARFLHPEMVGVRSQDQPRTYALTGAICLARVPDIMSSGTFYGPDVRFEPIPWSAAVDIDDADDLTFARAVLALQSGS